MRIIEQTMWQDAKFRKNIKDIKERYFWLYLLTCSSSKTCGIFYLPTDLMIMETMLSEREILDMLAKFTKLGLILYNIDEEEILIYNMPKYNLCRLGKPMEDCLKKELSLVKDKRLIQEMVKHLTSYCYERTNDKKISILERAINIYKESININTNTNTINESCHDTINDEDWKNILEDLGE